MHRTAARTRRASAPLVALALPALALTACTSGDSSAGSSSASGGSLPTASASGSPSPAAPAPAPPGTSPADTVPDCRNDQLEVGAGEVQAAASTRSLVLELVNVSEQTCVVEGFGGLALADAAGAELPTVLRDVGGPAPRLETAPGAFATKQLSWRVVPDDGDVTRCVEGAQLLVTPPDQEPGLLLEVAVTACDGGQVDGGPWVRDAG